MFVHEHYLLVNVVVLRPYGSTGRSVATIGFRGEDDKSVLALCGADDVRRHGAGSEEGDVGGRVDMGMNVHYLVARSGHCDVECERVYLFWLRRTEVETGKTGQEKGLKRGASEEYAESTTETDELPRDGVKLKPLSKYVSYEYGKLPRIV